MSWPLLLAAALFVVVSATAAPSELGGPFHGRMAAERPSPAASDDESCWGSPEECPVVYYDDDDGIGAAAAVGPGRRQPQYYHVAASLLPTPYYISYSAMTPDSVPCSVPGASYYNCRPGGADDGDAANPYTRGCSAITQCRD